MKALYDTKMNLDSAALQFGAIILPPSKSLHAVAPGGVHLGTGLEHGPGLQARAARSRRAFPTRRASPAVDCLNAAPVSPRLARRRALRRTGDFQITAAPARGRRLVADVEARVLGMRATAARELVAVGRRSARPPRCRRGAAGGSFSPPPRPARACAVGESCRRAHANVPAWKVNPRPRAPAGRWARGSCSRATTPCSAVTAAPVDAALTRGRRGDAAGAARGMSSGRRRVRPPPRLRRTSARPRPRPRGRGSGGCYERRRSRALGAARPGSRRTTSGLGEALRLRPAGP